MIYRIVDTFCSCQLVNILKRSFFFFFFFLILYNRSPFFFSAVLRRFTGLQSLQRTIIEYAENSTVEYAISQMIRENSSCDSAQTPFLSFFRYFLSYKLVRGHVTYSQL